MSLVVSENALATCPHDQIVHEVVRNHAVFRPMFVDGQHTYAADLWFVNRKYDLQKEWREVGC
jgi:hypothetical protein